MKKSKFKGSRERHNLGRKLAFVLRELIPKIGVEHDEHGFCSLDVLLDILRQDYPNITIEHVYEVVEKDPQRRFEISKDMMIRAKAGHRYPVKPANPPTTPPEYLYHGTSEYSLQGIMSKGILRMGKAYVHLSTTVERAEAIGLRKTDEPVILRIRAEDAHKAGIKFWRSGQVSPDGEIVLSEEIPPNFIERL